MDNDKTDRMILGADALKAIRDARKHVVEYADFIGNGVVSREVVDLFEVEAIGLLRDVALRLSSLRGAETRSGR